MKKLIVITFMILIATMSFAQKKELEAAEKAIYNGDFARAKTFLGQVEWMMSSADDKLQGKYHFLFVKALYADGRGTDEDLGKALESLNKSGHVDAEDIKYIKFRMANTFLSRANTALGQKNYTASSSGYEKAYRLSPRDTLYLFHAATIAVNGQDYDSALKYYKELKDINYIGIETEYIAISKETGEEDFFPIETMRDISVQSGSHINPSEKKSKPRSGEVVKNIALIYVSQGDNEKAISAMKEARMANPDDLNLLLIEANIYYKMGDNSKYKELITEAAQKDPNNPELLYNLGVISAEAGDNQAAKDYYGKAIEIDPTYVNAHINTAALILAEEVSIVEEMNGLGGSASDDIKYEELKAKRTQLYKDAIPFLRSALEIKPNNLQAAKTLMNIYSVIGDTALFNELKMKVEYLENGGN